MRYTRRFWYGVRFAWLVQRGTPYCRRYAPRAMYCLCCNFIGQYQNFSGHSFIKRLPFGIGDKLVGSSVVVFEYEPLGFRLTPFVFRGFRKQRSFWLSASSQGSQSSLVSGMWESSVGLKAWIVFRDFQLRNCCCFSQEKAALMDGVA